jgi:hypothetical protein
LKKDSKINEVNDFEENDLKREPAGLFDKELAEK